MLVVMPRGYSPAGLAIVLALHACLLYVLFLERPGAEKAVAIRYSQLLFIVPPPPKPAVDTIPPPPSPAPTSRREQPAIAITPSKPPALPSIEIPAMTAPADPFAESASSDNRASLDMENLVKQAGKADRETRTDREMQAYGPVPGSMAAVMTKAFTEAKLAVPLKWHEAARVTELSPRGARKPIYQVKTAFGTYCLFYPDKLTEGTGQPKIADCPRSFGR